MSVGGGHVRVLLHGIPLWGCVGVEVRVLCLCLGLHGCKLLGRALGQWSIGNVLVHGDLGAATAAAACGAARHPPAAARHDRQQNEKNKAGNATGDDDCDGVAHCASDVIVVVVIIVIVLGRDGRACKGEDCQGKKDGTCCSSRHRCCCSWLCGSAGVRVCVWV